MRAPEPTAGGSEPAAEAADLLRRAARREPEALDRWFRREHPAVWRVCLGLLADAAEADDAAQDAMLHLLDRADRYDGRRPWRTWRNSVVANLCRDRLRRRAARARAEADAAALRLPASLPDPAAAAARDEVRAALEAALGALSPREREAFVLLDLEGLSTAEAAEALGVAPSSARSLLALARRRLRGLLGERLVGPAPGGADARA